MLVIGADVGRTGARAALAADGEILVQTELIGVTDRVQAVDSMVRELMQRGAVTAVEAVAVGAAGFQMTGERLREQLPRLLPARTVLLCSDMLSSYAGALGLEPGAVVAAGTGAVALGADMKGVWTRVDGWGYLLGDLGSGAWIGRMGMQAAMRAADGRPGGSPTLLKAVTTQFGEPARLVAELTARPDRSGVMASFVPAVAEAARDGDAIAAAILADAGGHLADTALAALPGEAKRIATTGNLFRLRGPLWEAFRHRVEQGGAQLRQAAGTSVDGALALARAAVLDTLPLNAPAEVTVKN